MPHKATKLLVFIDENNYSKTALKFAAAKAKTTGCPVEMLYVIEHADFLGFGSLVRHAKNEGRSKAEETLKKLADEAHEYAGITPSLIVREGDIKEEIIKTVKEDEDINMLLIGTAHELRGKKNKLLISLVSELGEKLNVPILIVPGDLTDRQILELS